MICRTSTHTVCQVVINVQGWEYVLTSGCFYYPIYSVWESFNTFFISTGNLHNMQDFSAPTLVHHVSLTVLIFLNSMTWAHYGKYTLEVIPICLHVQSAQEVLAFLRGDKEFPHCAGRLV